MDTGRAAELAAFFTKHVQHEHPNQTASAVLTAQNIALLVTTPILESITKMSETLGTAITGLQADVAALTTVANDAVAKITSLSTELSAAVASAAAAGATPDQLAALNALDASIKADSAALSAAVTPAAPAAP